jgi:hypothetical protein
MGITDPKGESKLSIYQVGLGNGVWKEIMCIIQEGSSCALYFKIHGVGSEDLGSEVICPIGILSTQVGRIQPLGNDDV